MLLEPMLIASAVAGLSACLLVGLRRRRRLLIALAAQYGSLIWLVQGPYGQTLGAVKALTGVTATLILWRTLSMVTAHPNGDGDKLVDRSSFRFVAGLVVLLAGVGISRGELISLPQLDPAVTLAATWMMASGLLQAGLFERPLRMGIGLLTFLSGFELIYSVLEPSLAVAALLAGVHLGLALIASYLMRSQAWPDHGEVGARR